MLGQPASSQTVCRPSRRTSDFSSVYSGPVFSLVLIHGGLRSIGVSALRTSRRRSFRPSGATVTLPAYVSRLGGRSGGGSADEPEAPDGPGVVRQQLVVDPRGLGLAQQLGRRARPGGAGQRGAPGPRQDRQ